jgi:hypothetical protein
MNLRQAAVVGQPPRDFKSPGQLSEAVPSHEGRPEFTPTAVAWLNGKLLKEK